MLALQKHTYLHTHRHTTHKLDTLTHTHIDTATHCFGGDVDRDHEHGPRVTRRGRIEPHGTNRPRH
jgi:hypothetical protein